VAAKSEAESKSLAKADAKYDRILGVLASYITMQEKFPFLVMTVDAAGPTAEELLGPTKPDLAIIVEYVTGKKAGSGNKPSSSLKSGRPGRTRTPAAPGTARALRLSPARGREDRARPRATGSGDQPGVRGVTATPLLRPQRGS